LARDADQTKRRIFEAATTEFAEHGIAGARIDRIAAVAGANKQLIYAYFGSKRELFEAVVSEQVCRYLDEVPFDPKRLPEYAGAAFDYFTAHPEAMHLGSWHSLEPGEKEHRIPVIEQAIRSRSRLVSGAQKAGFVDASLAAADLLAVLSAVASTWAVATPERNPRRGAGVRAHARRRAAVVEVATRLVTPNGATASRTSGARSAHR
jgi:AcrR family transcriptional regulator